MKQLIKTNFEKRIYIPIWKFVVLNILTLGLYQFYWLYWTWYFLEVRNSLRKPKVMKVLLRILVTTFSHSVIHEQIEKLRWSEQTYEDYVDKFTTISTIAYPICLYSFVLLISLNSLEALIFSFLSFIFMIPVLKHMNKFWIEHNKKF